MMADDGAPISKGPEPRKTSIGPVIAALRREGYDEVDIVLERGATKIRARATGRIPAPVAGSEEPDDIDAAFGDDEP